MRVRLSSTTIACAAVAMLAVARPASAQDQPDTTQTIQPIPRTERPILSVSPLEFTATPGKDDMEELNTLGGALAALKGADPRERQKETQANLGKAAAAILTERLLNSGQFRVVERAMLDQVRKEQAINDSTAPARALTGAGYVVTGQITNFAKSKQKKGGLLGVAAKAAGVGALMKEQTAYEIGLTVRVVDAATGEIVTSITTEGVAVGNKKLAVAGGGVAGAVLGGAFGSDNSDEREKKIAESMRVAVDKLVVQFVGAREQGLITP